MLGQACTKRNLLSFLLLIGLLLFLVLSFLSFLFVLFSSFCHFSLVLEVFYVFDSL